MKIRQWFQRPLNISLSVILAGTGLLPLFFGGSALAVGGQITSRSIEISSSQVSATGVSYLVGFTPYTTGAVDGIVVDFCSNDPIPGDSCTAPTGFSLGAPTVTGQTTGITSLTTTTDTDANTLILTGTGTNTAGTPVSFTISSVTNSSSNGTFYARILTYTTAATAEAYTSASPGAYVDYGGIALSLANSLLITSKVQEELTFCVDANTTALTSCGSASGTAITLGDDHGVLSSSAPYVDKTGQYLVQTNAGTGAAVRVIGPTLTSGSSTIPAMTTPAAFPGSSPPSDFGLCSYASGGTTSELTIAQHYNGTNTVSPGTACSGTSQTAGTASPGGAGTTDFAFNTSTASPTYGDQIATASAGPFVTGTLVFGATASVTQTAGIYATTLNFIATGTY